MGRCLAGGRVSFSVFQKIRRVCTHSLLEVVKVRASGREESFECCINRRMLISYVVFEVLELNGQQGFLKKLQPEHAGRRLGKLGRCAADVLF